MSISGISTHMNHVKITAENIGIVANKNVSNFIKTSENSDTIASKMPHTIKNREESTVPMIASNDKLSNDSRRRRRAAHTRVPHTASKVTITDIKVPYNYQGRET